MQKNFILRLGILTLKLDFDQRKAKPVSTKIRSENHLKFAKEKNRRARASLTAREIVINF